MLFAINQQSEATEHKIRGDKPMYNMYIRTYVCVRRLALLQLFARQKMKGEQTLGWTLIIDSNSVAASSVRLHLFLFWDILTDDSKKTILVQKKYFRSCPGVAARRIEKLRRNLCAFSMSPILLK